MNDRICPFSATLAKQDFACPQAEQVIRRGGAEFSCRSATNWRDCTALHDRLKQVALPAFELEDDLTQVPHGVLAKIQFGGLLGLQRLLDNARHDPARVDDITALVNAAASHYGSLEAVPCAALVEDITRHRLSRRRRR